jgi:hypothetical protein
MVLQEAATTLRESHRAVVAVQRDSLDESLIFQVAYVCGLARTPEIALRYDPKRPDGRERPRVRAVEHIVTVPVVHQLSFGSARQIEVPHEHAWPQRW